MFDERGGRGRRRRGDIRYVLLELLAEQPRHGYELMKELDRRLKVIDQVVRHMIVRVDEEKRVVDRTRTKRQSESERRRVKRGLPPQRSARRRRICAT